MTRKYCKAYCLRDLRQFHYWTEKREENAPELTDDQIVYLWDDLTVVRSPIIPEKDVLFDMMTPEWQEFCNMTLQFKIPQELRYAYESSTGQ
ncbi:MAG TPA: hypothetical protein VGL94_15340 [Ktedonobacteraceae bacterium]